MADPWDNAPCMDFTNLPFKFPLLQGVSDLDGTIHFLSEGVARSVGVSKWMVWQTEFRQLSPTTGSAYYLHYVIVTVAGTIPTVSTLHTYRFDTDLGIPMIYTGNTNVRVYNKRFVRGAYNFSGNFFMAPEPIVGADGRVGFVYEVHLNVGDPSGPDVPDVNRPPTEHYQAGPSWSALQAVTCSQSLETTMFTLASDGTLGGAVQAVYESFFVDPVHGPNALMASTDAIPDRMGLPDAPTPGYGSTAAIDMMSGYGTLSGAILGGQFHVAYSRWTTVLGSSGGDIPYTMPWFRQSWDGYEAMIGVDGTASVQSVPSQFVGLPPLPQFYEPYGRVDIGTMFTVAFADIGGGQVGIVSHWQYGDLGNPQPSPPYGTGGGVVRLLNYQSSGAVQTLLSYTWSNYGVPVVYAGPLSINDWKFNLNSFVVGTVLPWQNDLSNHLFLANFQGNDILTPDERGSSWILMDPNAFIGFSPSGKGYVLTAGSSISVGSIQDVVTYPAAFFSPAVTVSAIADLGGGQFMSLLTAGILNATDGVFTIFANQHQTMSGSTVTRSPVTYTRAPGVVGTYHGIGYRNEPFISITADGHGHWLALSLSESHGGQFLFCWAGKTHRCGGRDRGVIQIGAQDVRTRQLVVTAKATDQAVTMSPAVPWPGDSGNPSPGGSTQIGAVTLRARPVTHNLQ